MKISRQHTEDNSSAMNDVKSKNIAKNAIQISAVQSVQEEMGGSKEVTMFGLHESNENLMENSFHKCCN